MERPAKQEKAPEKGSKARVSLVAEPLDLPTRGRNPFAPLLWSPFFDLAASNALESQRESNFSAAC